VQGCFAWLTQWQPLYLPSLEDDSQPATSRQHAQNTMLSSTGSQANGGRDVLNKPRTGAARRDVFYDSRAKGENGKGRERGETGSNTWRRAVEAPILLSDRRAQEHRRNLLRRMRDERERLYPFKPSLGKSLKDVRLPSGDVIARSQSWQKQREERLRRFRRELDQNLQRACTFQPNVGAANSFPAHHVACNDALLARTRRTRRSCRKVFLSVVTLFSRSRQEEGPRRRSSRERPRQWRYVCLPAPACVGWWRGEKRTRRKSGEIRSPEISCQVFSLFDKKYTLQIFSAGTHACANVCACEQQCS
jgi:hypothetical protein